jgi:hypothetical protein
MIALYQNHKSTKSTTYYQALMLEKFNPKRSMKTYMLKTHTNKWDL